MAQAGSRYQPTTLLITPFKFVRKNSLEKCRVGVLNGAEPRMHLFNPHSGLSHSEKPLPHETPPPTTCSLPRTHPVRNFRWLEAARRAVVATGDFSADGCK